jgi:hypothetical protein
MGPLTSSMDSSIYEFILSGLVGSGALLEEVTHWEHDLERCTLS